ncbi:hypothetical protein [Cryobacterium sp. M15]|nr:hypothetical protein [Cryobacterium sp. M15]
MFFAADLAVTPLTAAMVVAMTVAASAATAGGTASVERTRPRSVP